MSCSACHQPLTPNNTYTHPGADHSFHQECIKIYMKHSILFTGCPSCGFDLKGEKILTLKDKVSSVCTWAQYGALLSGVTFLTTSLLFGPSIAIQETLYSSAKRAVVGGICGGLLKIKAMALSSLMPSTKVRTFAFEQTRDPL